MISQRRFIHRCRRLANFQLAEPLKVAFLSQLNVSDRFQNFLRVRVECREPRPGPVQRRRFNSSRNCA